MPTISEMLAAKAAAASKQGAAAPVAKKPLPFPGLKISGDDRPKVEPWGEIATRSLASTSGEDVPRKPYDSTPQDVVWHSALEALNTELCVIPDPDPRNQRSWLAIRRPDDPTRPIYLFSLPAFPHPGPMPDPF